MRQSAALALTGIVIGAAGAFALTRLMSDLLFEVKPFDPLTFLAVSGGLGGDRHAGEFHPWPSCDARRPRRGAPGRVSIAGDPSVISRS